MKNKKRTFVILTCMFLNFAIMACHIPLISQTVGIKATSAETEIIEATAGLPTEVDETENRTLTPTQAVSIESDTTQVYYGSGVEITLPETFVVGEAEEFEALLEEEALLNGEHAQSIEAMFENFKDDILLWGYDTNPSSQGETGLFVIKNEQFGGMSLMIISAFAQSMIGSQVEIVEQERVTIDDRDMLRFLTMTGELGLEGSQVFYIFNEDGKLWIIGFFTNADQVQEHVQDFNDAVASFKIIEGE